MRRFVIVGFLAEGGTSSAPFREFGVSSATMVAGSGCLASSEYVEDEDVDGGGVGRCVSELICPFMSWRRLRDGRGSDRGPDGIGGVGREREGDGRVRLEDLGPGGQAPCPPCVERSEAEDVLSTCFGGGVRAVRVTTWEG